MQRVVGRLGRFDLIVDAAVESIGEAQVGTDAHVTPGRGDPERRLQVGAIDHLAGVGAFDPQIVRRLALGHQPAHARRDLRQPAAAFARRLGG